MRTSNFYLARFEARVGQKEVPLFPGFCSPFEQETPGLSNGVRFMVISYIFAWLSPPSVCSDITQKIIIFLKFSIFSLIILLQKFGHEAHILNLRHAKKCCMNFLSIATDRSEPQAQSEFAPSSRAAWRSISWSVTTNTQFHDVKFLLGAR